MKMQSGFTLIELVTVIVILAILSATALHKFIDLQSETEEATINGLKSALETASSLTFAKAIVNGKSALADETLPADESFPEDIQIRYGYPDAIQKNLKLLLNLNEDQWRLSGSGQSITFTRTSTTEGMRVAEIQSSTDICKLIYNRANRGERPNIAISGCRN